MLVYACPDLLFATRIRATAEAHGLPSRPARNREALLKRLDRVDDGKANDAVSVVVVDLDLEGEAIAMIEMAATHAAKPDVLAYGPHVATQLLAEASQRGAKRVLTRGSFTQQLEALAAQWAANLG